MKTMDKMLEMHDDNGRAKKEVRHWNKNKRKGENNIWHLNPKLGKLGYNS